MADLSAKDVARWQERIRHGIRVYEENGILGSSGFSAPRVIMEMYRGEHWKHMDGGWGGFATDDLAVDNIVYEHVNTSQAETSARNPKVTVKGRNQDSAESAHLVARLINYDIREQGMLRQWNAAYRDHHAFPVGIVRHGYTPEEELQDDKGRLLQFYRPARADRPWIKREVLRNVILDPLAEAWHNDGGMKWCAFRGLLTVDQIKRNPKMIARKDLAPNVGNPWKEVRPKNLKDEDNEDWNDLVEVFTVYEVAEKTWFQITLDGTLPLRQQADYPIPWEWLPIDLLAIDEQIDTPIPVALMAPLIPLQVELNKLHTIMGDLAKRVRRVILFNGSAFEEDEKDRLVSGDLAEWFETNGMNPSEVLQQVTVGSFPQELLLYDAMLQERIRSIRRRSKTNFAQRVNVESATEAAQIKEGADINQSRDESALLAFMGSSIRNYMQARRVTMALTGAELIPLLGSEDSSQLAGSDFFQEVSPENLHGEFEYEVDIGSTRPLDKRRDLQIAMVNYQTALESPEQFNVNFYAAKVVEAQGFSTARALTETALTASKVSQLAAIRDKAQPPVSGSTNSGARPVDPRALAGVGG